MNNPHAISKKGGKFAPLKISKALRNDYERYLMGQTKIQFVAKPRTMKTFPLMISKNFMTHHPRKGEPTLFKEKIFSGDKIHTIRANFAYWERIIKQVQAGKGVLSLRQWSGKPYYSTPVEFIELTKDHGIGIQPFGMLNEVISINNSYDLSYIGGKYDVIAKNDGLSRIDFDNWFRPNKNDFQGGIIQFTDFRYQK
jgi:hypothetical protein